MKLMFWLPVLVITFAFNAVNASQTAGTSRLAQALESDSESVKIRLSRVQNNCS